jgi:hypothetical protein
VLGSQSIFAPCPFARAQRKKSYFLRLSGNYGKLCASAFALLIQRLQHPHCKFHYIFLSCFFLALWCKSEKKHKYAQKAGAGKNGLVLVHSPFFTYSLAEAAV